MSPEPAPAELSTVFAHLHGIPLSATDATTAVSRLARVAHHLVPGATGAGASLGHRGRALGAMKGYAAAASAFGEAEQQRLGLLADAAATLLGSAQPVEAPVRLSESPKTALASRETVALAAGMLMARQRIAPEAARSVLLERARPQGRRVPTEVLEAA